MLVVLAKKFVPRTTFVVAMAIGFCSGSKCFHIEHSRLVFEFFIDVPTWSLPRCFFFLVC
jgi:hypothetical protein